MLQQQKDQPQSNEEESSEEPEDYVQAEPVCQDSKTSCHPEARPDCKSNFTQQHPKMSVATVFANEVLNVFIDQGQDAEAQEKICKEEGS